MADDQDLQNYQYALNFQRILEDTNFAQTDWDLFPVGDDNPSSTVQSEVLPCKSPLLSQQAPGNTPSSMLSSPGSPSFYPQATSKPLYNGHVYPSALLFPAAVDTGDPINACGHPLTQCRLCCPSPSPLLSSREDLAAPPGHGHHVRAGRHGNRSSPGHHFQRSLSSSKHLAAQHPSTHMDMYKGLDMPASGNTFGFRSPSNLAVGQPSHEIASYRQHGLMRQEIQEQVLRGSHFKPWSPVDRRPNMPRKLAPRSSIPAHAERKVAHLYADNEINTQSPLNQNHDPPPTAERPAKRTKTERLRNILNPENYLDSRRKGVCDGCRKKHIACDPSHKGRGRPRDRKPDSEAGSKDKVDSNIKSSETVYLPESDHDIDPH